MEQNEALGGNKRFGTYLRRVREGRKLSLDAVEELSAGYPERITKSHLSRIENGQALPSFPRLFALGQIYGVPVSSLAERFEVELQRDRVPGSDVQGSDEDILDAGKKLRLSGRYTEALSLYAARLDQLATAVAEPGREAGSGPPPGRARVTTLRLAQIDCLVHLNRYELAKSECEELLGDPRLTSEERLITLQLFVACCLQMSRFTVAMMGLEQARREVESCSAPPRTRADLEALEGSINVAAGMDERAVRAFTTAIELYEQLPNAYEANRSRINLAIALGKTERRAEARAHAEAAMATAEREGFDRQWALAASELAVIAFHEGNLAQAESHALRSNVMAREREYLSLVFRNCYYLWKIAQQRGDAAGVKVNERTLRAYLSRVEEFLPEARAFQAYVAGGEA